MQARLRSPAKRRVSTSPHHSRSASISSSTQSDGGWRGVDDSKTDWIVAIPAIAWSTPWTFLGARFEGYAAAPMLSWGIPALPGQVAGGLVGRNFIDMDVPYANVGLAWDLGGGFAFSTWGGSYLPVNNELRFIGFDA